MIVGLFYSLSKKVLSVFVDVTGLMHYFIFAFIFPMLVHLIDSLIMFQPGPMFSFFLFIPVDRNPPSPKFLFR